ncbi:MAG: hypothetical protein QM500_13635, partial [Methylococcales bacterium]
LSYAVAGNFVDTMSSWDEVSDLWKRNTEELIVISGLGSLRQEKNISQEVRSDEPDLAGIQDALSLVKRAVIVWVVLLGLLTVTGWLV